MQQFQAELDLEKEARQLTFGQGAKVPARSEMHIVDQNDEAVERADPRYAS